MYIKNVFFFVGTLNNLADHRFQFQGSILTYGGNEYSNIVINELCSKNPLKIEFF